MESVNVLEIKPNALKGKKGRVLRQNTKIVLTNQWQFILNDDNITLPLNGKEQMLHENLNVIYSYITLNDKEFFHEAKVFFKEIKLSKTLDKFLDDSINKAKDYHV